MPIIADIDAGFGNEEATYLMAKQMIEAGACAIQIENQVSDEKQCGHQDGKVTVPHAEFLAKINAVRYAFLELGVEDGVIVARTDSLGAGLTARIAITKEVGDLGDQYNSFLDTEEVNETDIKHGDVMINHHGKIVRPKRLPSNLYKFKEGTGEARCILDSITSLQSGADLIWIETEKPHIGQIAEMMSEIKKVIPNAKLVYNNSPSFNWTLNFRQQVFDSWETEGKDLSQYERDDLMSEKYDSSDLAKERGKYETFDGSLWSKGILPKDSIEILAENRGTEYLNVDRSETLDWDALRQRVISDGMRNSNVMAIAPTATISNITGVTQSIEPTYQNLYVKSNLSGEFTIVNPHLVRKLKDLGLWDEVMINDLKYYEGSLSQISRIPDDIKKLFSTAFEVEPRYIVESASRRQKWIDQGQSLNLYIGNADGKKLDITYRMAWYSGLKTTYYLRSIAATSTEKSTVQQGKLNAVSAGAEQAPQQELGAPAPVPTACSLDDPECEACQ